MSIKKEMSNCWELILPLPDDGGRSPNNGGKYIYLQFTGLKDKNGKEIYEGDMVEIYERGSELKIGREVHQVIWGGTEYPAFDLDTWEGETNAFAEIEQSGEWDIEIVGNIYKKSEAPSK